MPTFPIDVDFARPIEPIEDMDVPFSTDSINKFGVLAIKMLSACSSGSTGGDACRMMLVLNAALKEVNVHGKARGEAKAEASSVCWSDPRHSNASCRLFYRGDLVH